MLAAREHEEGARRDALGRYQILDTPPEAEFDRITALAAQLLRVPIAVITFIDEERQWFKSRVGLEVPETHRAISFCAHTLGHSTVLEIEDALRDGRFSHNPLVTGAPFVRFYAGAPLVTPDGIAIGALAVMDTTPRRLAAEESWLLARLAAVAMDELERRARSPAVFRSTDLRLALALDQLPATVWTTDRDLRFTSSIGAALEAAGLRPDEIVGRTLPEFLAADPDCPAKVAAHKRALRGEVAHLQSMQFGRTYTVRIDPLRDADRNIVGTIGIGIDVTGAVEAERELLRSVERFRLASRATGDVLWDWDMQADSAVWGEALEPVFGHDPARIAPTVGWFMEHVAPEDRARVEQNRRELLVTDRDTFATEFRFRRADGTYAEVLSRGSVVRDATGRPVRMVGAMIDVTERNRMRAQLGQAERLAALGTLAAGIAHEINNPLAYVLANVRTAEEEVMRLGADLPAAAQPLRDLLGVLKDAAEGATRTAAIVRSLRTFASGEERAEGVSDPRVAMEIALRMSEGDLKHAAVVRSELGAVPSVGAPESRLVKLFVHILLNAAQAIGSGRAPANEIRVTTRTTPGGWAEIAIIDSGPGIPPALRTRVFEPFFTTKPVGGGKGLGLSICHGIVTSLGGRIEIDSAPTRRGALVRILLPPAPAPAPAAEEAPAPVAATRVLIVDDEEPLCRALARALRPSCDAHACTSGRQAQDLLARDQRFDVILCDVMMPDVDGVELYQWLGRVAPDLARRMVFMTGGAPPAALVEIVPPVEVIEKPFDVSVVRAVVARVAGRAVH